MSASVRGHRVTGVSMPIRAASATTSFSPGSEVARDKQVHVCTGFAAWEFRGDRPQPVDPLGPPLTVKKCPECGAGQATGGPDGQPCEFCLATTGVFDLYQPLGFRTQVGAEVAEP